MSCLKCERDVPIENKDLGLCATCNKAERDTDELYPLIRKMFLQKMIDIEEVSPLDGTPITIDSDIHHKKGREGYADEWAREKGITLLIDVRFFLACSRRDHQWIEAPENRKKSEAMGFILSRHDIDPVVRK